MGYTSPKYLKRVVGGAPGMVQVGKQEGLIYGSPDRGLKYFELYGPNSAY